jgi:hypothetical protein
MRVLSGRELAFTSKTVTLILFSLGKARLSPEVHFEVESLFLFFRSNDLCQSFGRSGKAVIGAGLAV